MVSRVSRNLSVKISRTVAMALGAVALSSQTRRKTLISVSEKPMSCSFWIHSMRLTPSPGTCESRPWTALLD